MAHTAEDVRQALGRSTRLSSPILSLTGEFLTGPDTRTLVLGPSPRSPLGAITEGVVLFLRDRGLDADSLSFDLPLRAHREEAATYSYILALPLTMGPAAEVVDFMQVPDLRRKMVVVVPERYSTSYLVKLVAESDARHASCSVVSPRTVDADVGIECLSALLAHAMERPQLDAAEDVRQLGGSQQDKLPPDWEELDDVTVGTAPAAALADDDEALALPAPASSPDGDSRFLRGVVAGTPILAAIALVAVAAAVGGVLAALIVLVPLALLGAALRFAYVLWDAGGHPFGTTWAARALDYLFSLYSGSEGEDRR